LLKNKQFAELELENLIEEIESMGRSEKNALKSNLRVLIMHLLKYKFQPQNRSNSWLYIAYNNLRKLTSHEERDRIPSTSHKQGFRLFPRLTHTEIKKYSKRFIIN
ncbi:MAG: DUF29 family protein, partial [Sphaerospermopsis kisseleviana]